VARSGLVDPNAGKACPRSGGTGIIDAQISKEQAREHYFFFALNSLMYFSGFSLKASRQPEQQT
jgi:predicted kinase